MRNTDLDWDEQYDYGPNEMAELQRTNPTEYNTIMHQNIGDERAIEKWENSNLEWAKDCLAQQRLNRR